MQRNSLLTKNSPSKLGGVPQGRGSVRNFIEYSQQSTEYRVQRTENREQRTDNREQITDNRESCEQASAEEKFTN